MDDDTIINDTDNSESYSLTHQESSADALFNDNNQINDFLLNEQKSKSSSTSINEIFDNDDFCIETNEIPYKVQMVHYLKAKTKKRNTNETYYCDVDEYHGIIEMIDIGNKTFTAYLTNINDNCVITAEFSFDDVQFESDKDLIKIGAPLIWIIGKEIQILSNGKKLTIGPQKNISKFIFRRLKVLSNSDKEKANDEASRWARFFEQCSTKEDT